MSAAAPQVLVLPPGYGLRAIPKSQWTLGNSEEDPFQSMMDRLQIWELPRRDAKYIAAVDVSDGVGADYSVIDVIRIGSLQEPHEQVAQFVSNSIDAVDFAYYVDTVGRFYRDGDDLEALAAVEIIGPGIATQAMLQRHLGYTHFYRWQLEAADSVQRGMTHSIGFRTTTRSRDWVLSYLVKAFKTYESAPESPDIKVNSPLTCQEMEDFQTEGSLREARAAEGAHDDCLMALAIGLYVAQIQFFEENEPLAEARRRLAEQARLQEEESQRIGHRRDFINSPITKKEMSDDVIATEDDWNDPEASDGSVW